VKVFGPRSPAKIPMTSQGVGRERRRRGPKGAEETYRGLPRARVRAWGGGPRKCSAPFGPFGPSGRKKARADSCVPCVPFSALDTLWTAIAAASTVPICDMLLAMFPFRNGRPRKPRPLVENTPRVPQPPSAGPAREAVGVVFDGVERTLDIVRQPRIHGQEAFWLCAKCSKPRWHLYLLNGEVACRECFSLGYACWTHNRAALRARRLRRKLGGAPGLLSPIPKRPKHWRRDYWARTLAELIAAEAVLAARLGDMVGRKRKRI